MCNFLIFSNILKEAVVNATKTIIFNEDICYYNIVLNNEFLNLFNLDKLYKIKSVAKLKSQSINHLLQDTFIVQKRVIYINLKRFKSYLKN